MTQPIAEISQRNASTTERMRRSVAWQRSNRMIPKLGWHFWFILVDLLSGFCFGGVASGQDCPGGQCPIGQSRPPMAGGSGRSPRRRRPITIARLCGSAAKIFRSRARRTVAPEPLSPAAPSRGLVLTASHVVEQGGGRIWVDFGRGRQTASLLGRDANLDLAALVVDNPPADVRAIPVAGEDEWPHAGENVEVVGFGGGRFRHFVRPRPWLHGEKDARRRSSQLVVAFPADQRRQRRSHPCTSRKLAGILWGGPCDGPATSRLRNPRHLLHLYQAIPGRDRRAGSNRGGHRRRNRQGTDPSPDPPARTDAAAAGRTAGGTADAAQSADSERLAAIEKRLDDLAARLSPIERRAGRSPGCTRTAGFARTGGPAGKDADPAALAAIAGRVTATGKKPQGQAALQPASRLPNRKDSFDLERLAVNRPNPSLLGALS